MPKIADAAVRVALVERAAEMLARREPVSLRSLVEGTGASTMAVYTHFGGMPGLWRAVRQEGFTRLKARLDHVRPTADPVRDMAALGAAYAGNALEFPALYRAMFDTQADLDDPAAADAAFGVLIAAAARAKEGRRFAETCDPAALATQAWAAGHGLVMLVITGVMPREALETHARAILVALYTAAGDDAKLCEASVRRGFALG